MHRNAHQLRSLPTRATRTHTSNIRTRLNIGRERCTLCGIPQPSHEGADNVARFVLKRAIMNKTVNLRHFPPLYHVEKSRRNLVTEHWLLRDFAVVAAAPTPHTRVQHAARSPLAPLQRAPFVQIVGGNTECDAEVAGHVVEFVPQSLDAFAARFRNNHTADARCDWCVLPRAHLHAHLDVSGALLRTPHECDALSHCLTCV